MWPPDTVVATVATRLAHHAASKHHHPGKSHMRLIINLATTTPSSIEAHAAVLADAPVGVRNRFTLVCGRQYRTERKKCDLLPLLSPLLSPVHIRFCSTMLVVDVDCDEVKVVMG